MKFRPSIPPPVFCVIASILAGFPFARAVDWQPISPEDLAATVSPIDPDAGAEIIYRYVEIDDAIKPHKYGTYHHEYNRIKFYNDKGIAALGKIDVAYNHRQVVRNLMARVLKSDGTILNLDKKSFYERVIIKADGVRVDVYSFSVPSLSVGDIIEYKWDIRATGYLYGLFLRPMRNFPVRHVRFRVKPFSQGIMELGVFYNRCEERRLEKDKSDFYCIDFRDLPAPKREPYMPPDDEVQPWLLIYPKEVDQKTEQFWLDVGRQVAGDMAAATRRPSRKIRETATSITQGVASVEGRARRINDFCRANIVNTDLYTPESGIVAKEKLRSDPDYTLEQKQGRTIDIATLFHALARAVGLDSRVALCSDRSEYFFRESIHLSYLLSQNRVAVKDGKRWLFFDPASDIVPTGYLRWYNEGVRALVGTPRSVEWVETPITPPEKSREKRVATLRLNREGSLTGSIRIDYSGHDEARARVSFMHETPARREEIVREGLQARLPGAEIDKLEVSGIDNITAPLFLTCNVRVPHYADQVGHRLFFEPSFFTNGTKRIFTEGTREHDIYFPFPDSIEDEVTISLPPGFVLEEAGAPPPMPEAARDVYDVSIGYKKIPTPLYTNGRSVLILCTFQRSHTLASRRSWMPFIYVMPTHWASRPMMLKTIMTEITYIR
jgi:transglutaminase-like putative cysteine protease